MVITILGMIADMELKFIRDRESAGIEAAKAGGVYKGRAKNDDDYDIRRRIEEGATKASVARDMKISRMTVYRAFEEIPDKTSFPDKRPTGILTLRIDPPGRSVAKSRVSQTLAKIEEMLERDYAMARTEKGEYRLKVVYDPEPDGMSFNEEIELLGTRTTQLYDRRSDDVSLDEIERILI